MSDRITWTTCPRCGEAAAVGWLQEKPLEFDCRAGCTLADLHPSMTAWYGFVAECRSTRSTLEVAGPTTRTTATGRRAKAGSRGTSSWTTEGSRSALDEPGG